LLQHLPSLWLYNCMSKILKLTACPGLPGAMVSQPASENLKCTQIKCLKIRLVNYYCIVNAPGTTKLFPAFTIILAPDAMYCVTFNKHSPPATGFIIMVLKTGKVAGGILLLLQLAALSQLPFPVKV
jgi:hypothetical protein